MPTNRLTPTHRRSLVGIAVAGAIVAGGLVARDQLAGDAQKPVLSPAAQILILMNQVRAKHHLVPLKRDAELADLARFHNRNMRSAGFFAHDHPQAQTFYERMAYLNRRYTGEVLAYGSGGFSTPKGLVDLWMASPGHKRVILGSGFRRVGISVLCGSFLNQRGVCLSTADFSS